MDLHFFTDIAFLKSDVFRITVPLVSAALGVWIKSDMRHPEKQAFRKEDFAVGVQLIQTACLSFLLLVTQKAVQLHSKITAEPPTPKHDLAPVANFLAFSALRLAFMLFVLFGMTSFVRRKGWKNKDEMEVLQGIALPIAAGIFCLYTVIGAAQ